MSVREFAAHLGVSDRMVSKWEAGGSGIRPRPVNQAALDTSLAQAPAEVRARFALIVTSTTAQGPPPMQADSMTAAPSVSAPRVSVPGRVSTEAAHRPATVAALSFTAASAPVDVDSAAGGSGTESGDAGSCPGVAASASPGSDQVACAPPQPRACAIAAPLVRHLLVHPEDGRLMTLVDAGAFRYGHDAAPVWLPGFYIDVCQVTNAEYAKFVAATGRASPSHWPAGRCPGELLEHPVVNVSWRDAQAYAAWAGKSLATLQQWEKAARGLSDAPYPWGSQPDPARCNVKESGLGSTVAVLWYEQGVSPFGAFGMCGNVWEWCAAPAATSMSPSMSSCASGDIRQRRGGSFASPIAAATVLASTEAPADWSSPDTGFRCVISAQELLALLAI